MTRKDKSKHTETTPLVSDSGSRAVLWLKNPRDAVALLLGLAAIFFLFRPMLNYYFVSDTWGDLYAVLDHNPLFYTYHDTYAGKLGRHYRPLWRLSGWIQHKLSGSGAIFDPRIFFTFQLLWHLVTCAGVYVAARILGATYTASLAALFFFGAHPAVAEPVAWTAAESFLLAGMFGIWAVVMTVLAERDATKKRFLRIIALLLGTASMLSNEIGLGVLPGLILIAYAIASGESAGSRRLFEFGFLRTHMFFVIACVALPALYLLYRILLFGAVTNWQVGPSPEGVLKINELADAPKYFLQRVLWNHTPKWLHLEVSMNAPKLFLLYAAIGIAVVCYFAVVRRSVTAALIIFALLTCLSWLSSHRLYPTSHDPYPTRIVGGRLLYVALPALSVAAGLWLTAVQQQASGAVRLLVTVLAFWFLCGNAVQARVNLHIWGRAGEMVRTFVHELPRLVPRHRFHDTIAVVKMPLWAESEPIPGYYTNMAYAFQVATGYMAQYAYRDRTVRVFEASDLYKAPSDMPAVTMTPDDKLKLLR